MIFIIIAHSLLRWLIVIVAILAGLRFAAGWLRRLDFTGSDRGLNVAFSGLMDLQAVVGIVLFLWDGFSGAGFPAFRWLHFGIMVVAAVLAHFPAFWKNAASPVRHRNNFLLLIGVMALVIIGVLVLPAGDFRWSLPQL